MFRFNCILFVGLFVAGNIFAQQQTTFSVVDIMKQYEVLESVSGYDSVASQKRSVARDTIKQAALYTLADLFDHSNHYWSVGVLGAMQEMVEYPVSTPVLKPLTDYKRAERIEVIGEFEVWHLETYPNHIDYGNYSRPPQKNTLMCYGVVFNYEGSRYVWIPVEVYVKQ